MVEALKINQCLIQEIDNFIPMIKTLPLLANKDSLVIFDVDGVLIMPDQNNDFRHPYRAQLWQELKNRLSTQETDILHSKILSSMKWQLLESRILEMFNFLNAQHIPTMALTAMGTGKYGVIKKKEDFRIHGLNSVDLSFAALTPLKGQQSIIISDKFNLKDQDYHHGVPMLKNGIIFTAQTDKGLVLEYMLQKYNYKPQKIIFVDDLLIHLKSLKQLCCKLSIDFYGYHYTGSSFMSLPDLDEGLERLRFKILEQEGVWLNYKQLEHRRDLNSYSFFEIYHGYHNHF